MKSLNPNSGIYEADTSRTLDCNAGNPSCNQGGMAVVAFNGGASPASDIAFSDKVVPTLRAGPGSTMTPFICEPVILNDQGGDSMSVEKTEISPTLRSETHGNLPIVCSAYGFDLQQITSKTNRSTLKEVQPSLCAAGNPHIVHPKIAGTLCGSGAGLSRPAGMASETDLAIAYCLQGNMIGRDDRQGPMGSGVNEEISFTLNCTDRPAVAVDCRNYKEVGELSGCLQAKNPPGYSLNYQNPIRDGYIVRRLTPIECERLMGFEDGYTAIGHDGRTISDNKRYSMLGNSIAVPCVVYIMQGIIEQYEKEELAENLR